MPIVRGTAFASIRCGIGCVQTLWKTWPGIHTMKRHVFLCLVVMTTWWQ